MSFLPFVSSNDIDAVKRLSQSERDDLATRINQTDPHNVFTAAGDSRNPDKRKIICPNCQNGRGEDGTPVEATWKIDRWLYHCFKGNDLEGDLLKIIATEKNLDLNSFDGMAEALATGASLIGYSLFKNYTISQSKNKSVSAQVSKKTSQEKDNVSSKKLLDIIHADITDAQNHIQDLPENARRGLTLATLFHFGFGYLAQWTHPNTRLEGKTVPTSRRIIIPSDNHYNAIALPVDREGIEKKYWKMHAGSMELFNQIALAEPLICLVEGEIDAASIWQAYDGKIAVCAVLGAANWKKTLSPKLKGITDKKFLILFDGDDAGRKNAQNLRDELIKSGHLATCRFYYDALFSRLQNQKTVPFKFDNKIDANQILQATDGYFLRSLTQELIESAEQDFSALEKEITDMQLFDKFIDAWKHNNSNADIDANIIAELKDAKNYVDALTTNNFNPTDVDDLLIRRKVALCRFYLPDIAQNFFTVMKAAQKRAKAILKLIADETATLKKKGEPIPELELDAIKNLAALAPSKIESEINKLVTKIERQQKAFTEQKVIDALNAREKAQKEAHRNLSTKKIFSDCPIDLFLPDGVYLDDKEGIRRIDWDKPVGRYGRPVIGICSTPIVPTKIFREPNKHITQYEVAIKTGNIWRFVIVDGRTLIDPRKILALADYGALIKNPAHLAKYFAEIIHLRDNKGKIPEIKAYSQTGWTDDTFTTFAFPHNDNYIVRRAGFDFDRDLATRGDAELWKKKFIEVTNKGGAVAAMYIGTALASILARPLNIMNPQAHLHGTSGGGKTALQKFAASIFGNPRELLRNFAATNKNRQLVAAAFCDLPSFYDELETIPGKAAEDNLSNDVYNFADGKGNQANKRDGTARETFRFGGARLTTGERPILKQHDLRGAYKRLLQFSLREKIFEDDFAADLHIFSESNFGHFGRLWIQFVTEHMKEIQVEYQRRASRRDVTTTSYEPTHLKQISACLVAVEFFKVMLGVTSEFDVISFIRNWRIICDTQLPTLAQLDDTARALEALKSFVGAHERYFLHEIKNSGTDEEPTFTFANETYGKIFDDGAVAFFPTELTKILEKELGFASADKLIAEWSENGTLKTNAGRATTLIRINKKVNRVYYFKAGTISSSNDSAESSYYEKLSGLNNADDEN